MTNDPTNPAGQITPACNAYAITTSDSATLSPITRAVYVGGTGDLKVVMRGGQTVTFAQVQAGTVLPIEVQKVKATGTTATSILGLY